MATSELIEALQALAHERKIDEFYLIERFEARLPGATSTFSISNGTRASPSTGRPASTSTSSCRKASRTRKPASTWSSRSATSPRTTWPHRRAERQGRHRVHRARSGRQSIYEKFSTAWAICDRHGAAGTPDFTIIKIRDGVEAELPHYDTKRSNERNERPANEHYRHNQRLKVLIIEVRDPNSTRPARRSGAPGHRRLPHPSRPHPPSLRDRGAGNLRRHGGDQVHRPRARRPLQGGRVLRARRTWIRWAPAWGRKGSRVRMVVEELRNERVDVIQWSEDPAVYVANAPVAGEGEPRGYRRGEPLRHGHRARRPAVAGHRQGGPERALGRGLTGWHIDIKSASFTGESLALVDKNVLMDEDEAEDDDDGLCALHGGGRNPLPQPRPAEQPLLRRARRSGREQRR